MRAVLDALRRLLCGRRQPQPEKGTYRFPDGSMYAGQTLNGKLHGIGEWRSAGGDWYVGSFHEDQFHGNGRHTDVVGNVYSGTFRNGAFDGSGTYLYNDGRAEICRYSMGQCDGKKVRWSTARTQAWSLTGDNVDAEISLSEAAAFALSLGLQVPDSIYMVSPDGQQRLREQVLRLSTDTAGGQLAFDAYIAARNGSSQGCLVAHSRCALVQASVCDGIIAECEARAKALGGWTTKRHDSNPTTDVPVQRLPHTLSWFCGKLLPDVAYPFLAKAFSFALPAAARTAFCVTDAFVVKYDAAAGQRFLKPHRDGSGQRGSATVFSFNVALNDLDEYEGGGTYFRRLADSTDEPAGPVRSGKGHLLAHSSALWHGGHPITSGVRYILVAFVTVDASHADWAYQFYEHVRTVDDPD